MKDAKSRLSNPIEPVDRWDVRPTVLELCGKHRAEILHLKDQLVTNELFDGNCHDDLWLLRFVLSHGKHALAAIQATLAFRHEHHLDALDLRQWNAGNATALADQLQVQEATASTSTCTSTHVHMIQATIKMLSCYEGDTTMIYYLPDRQRGLLGFLQVAQRHQHKMIATLSQEDYFQAHLFMTEWKFQWIDHLTRTTGRLTKYLNLADCQGVKRSMIHKESKKRDAHAAELLQDRYPQLLGSMLITNAPTWINVVFAMLKPFLNKRLLDKVNVLPHNKKKTPREKDILCILHYCAIHHLPHKYGGQLPDPNWPPSTEVTVTL
jgi:CRAL/TRIO domain